MPTRCVPAYALFFVISPATGFPSMVPTCRDNRSSIAGSRPSPRLEQAGRPGGPNGAVCGDGLPHPLRHTVARGLVQRRRDVFREQAGDQRFGLGHDERILVPVQRHVRELGGELVVTVLQREGRRAPPVLLGLWPERVQLAPVRRAARGGV